MIQCPVCAEKLQILQLCCTGCDVRYEGTFHMPRLARLTRDQQKLAEAFILSGGNLKELSGTMEVSYPTLRKKVDSLIESLELLHKADEQQIESVLKKIEDGHISAARGLRLIKEINGEL